MCEEISEGLGRIIAAVRASLRRLEEGQKQIIDRLVEISEQSAQAQPARESYSSAETARLLGKRPFTVREWCRLGRIKAKKRPCGSGASFAWEISASEIERIRNHGLLPIPKRR
jgi:hypothetical protein